jgi:hypothetical protein
MRFSSNAKYFLGGLAAFVIAIILQRWVPIRLPAYLDLMLVVAGISLMGLLYYRRTRDLWAPLLFLIGWLVSGIPPRTWMIFSGGRESIGVIISLTAQAVGVGLLLAAIVLGTYRLFRLISPRNP